MSSSVFPTLVGLKAERVRTPMFNSERIRAVSGREVAFSMQVYPLYRFDLQYDVLRAVNGQVELQTLAGFYEAMRGTYDSFLFTDWLDNSVTDAQFGVGDGTTTAFQLTRAFGGGGFTYVSPVQNVNTLTNIKKAGVTQTGGGTDYTINSSGLVTFTSAPAAAASLTWTGTFYYRCRFMTDEQEFSNFMYGMWEVRKLSLLGATGNRIL